ncbi:PQQ-dependent sugar dehydrogenase [Iningainema tapete]|uniref:PQQ-dependent sugar dehydrogenase n=1 Tax=Iningainema tapete BLCC-T55 TaxID=2748662 RepID=A0A8J6XVD0_9CYAN|nr:PQQ-dependent sugar dehydrogenase [Iningainema tapete]MBD2776842.1 PQQ-dependent sugar dehydrogenase [Iningainema tapete BLCC-T55]
MKSIYRFVTFFVTLALVIVIHSKSTAQQSFTPIALRNDIQLRRVIDTGGYAVRIAKDPLSSQLYYLDAQANIYRLDIQPTEGSTKTLVYTFQDIGGAQETSGMAFAPDGTLYVVSNLYTDNTFVPIVRKGVLDASGVRTWSTLFSTVPIPRSNTAFDHVFNGIAVSPDGNYVYVNSGSRTDHGEVQSSQGVFPDVREVPLTSAIFRIPTNVTDLVLPNDEAELKANGYLFADGVRNSFDPTFAPNGDLIAGDNGPDADYTEELNWLREGQHYGFPWKLGSLDNPQQFPDYDPAQDPRLQPDFYAVQNGFYYNDPNFPPPSTTFTEPIANLGPDADQFVAQDGSLQDASDSNQPLYTFTPHRSPLGLTFDTEGVLPNDFKGDAFILSYGAADGNKKFSDGGQDLLHLKLNKVGDTYQVNATQIVRSFNRPIDSVIFNHKLYVLEWGEPGSIWELTFVE